MQEQISSSSSNSSSGGQKTNRSISVDVEPITGDMIDKIMQVEHVVDYNAIVSTQGYADDFTPITANEAEGEEDSDRTEQGGMSININGQDASSMTMPDVTIYGVTSTEVTDTFKSGSDSIVEGEGITSTDTEKTAVIEKQLATANDLEVGDKIKIKPSSDGDSIELTIIGIYETSETSTSTGLNLALTQPYNKIYVNNTTALEIKSNANEQTSGKGIRMGGSTDGIDSVVFSIDDPVNMDTVLEYIAELDIDWDKFKVDANNSAYETMMGPIENVASFSNLVVWIVGITGGIILMLVLTLWIRERMHETGVLLSLGEHRAKVILQYMSEVLIIAILAFTLSIFTGRYIAKGMGDMLLQNEIKVSEESSSSNQNQTGGRTTVIGGGQLTSESANNVEVIDEIDVSVDFNSVMKLYGVGILLTLVGTIIPAITIMRYNPKKILTNA